MRIDSPALSPKQFAGSWLAYLGGSFRSFITKMIAPGWMKRQNMRKEGQALQVGRVERLHVSGQVCD